MENLKKSLIVWISIYPPLTIILAVFSEYLNAVPLIFRTLILTIVLVPLMVYILIPFWTRMFNRISSKKRRKSKTDTATPTKPLQN